MAKNTKFRIIQNSKMYIDNTQVAKQCKMVTSLAFLLVEEIPNEIVNMYLTFTQELFPLLFYFDSMYISGKNSTPRFPLQIWNVRNQTMNNSHIGQIILVKDGTVHSIN